MANIEVRPIRGTFGRLWVNGELMANIKSFELKASMTYETLDKSGELCEQNRYTKYALAGTMTCFKTDDRLISLVREGMTTGVMPKIKLIGAVTDPDSNGSTRIEVYNVTFDEVTLMQFENATIGEEQVPFKAGGFKYLDMNI